MSQKIYSWILKGGVLVSFLTVFFVFSDLLFPFITSKQIYFNIWVELLLIFWLGLIIKYPSWRPFRFGKSKEDGAEEGAGKNSYITWGLAAFLLAITASSIAGVDFNLSFWGDIERMLGVFHVLHFFALYLIVITVFRSRQDWNLLLWTSIIACTIEALLVGTHYGGTNYGTIGNTAYVSGYMIFNIYFALLLFFRHKNWWLRGTLAAMILVMFNGMVVAATRGAYVGFGASIILLCFLIAMLSRNKLLKIGSIAAVAALVILVIAIFKNADSDWVKNNHLFARLSAIRASSNTFQTRLISWKAGFKDFPHHPILGTGFGNYAISFDKYFDPKFYNASRGETYFDRAHNNLIDITTTSGAVGLLTYLSIFAAAFYYLIKGYRARLIDQKEFILLVSLIVAYFIQNLAVFDSFVTYAGMMIMLGYIYHLGRAEARPEQDEPWTNKEFYALIAGAAVLLGILYQYNYKPLLMLQGTIDGQIQIARSGDLGLAVNAYRKALGYDTVLDRDSRSSLAQLVLGQASRLYGMDKQKAAEILDFTIGGLKKNVAYNPQDSFMEMNLAQVLNLAASMNTDNPEKFSYYSTQAEEAINKSIEASPGRVTIYPSKAQIYLTRGDREKAIETLKYALNLNPIYPDVYCQLSRIYFYYKEEKQGLEYMNGCIDYDGLSQLGGAAQIKEIVKYYIDKKDWPRVVKLYAQLKDFEPNDPRNWAVLANAYRDNRQYDEAIAAAEKAAELDPKFKAGADDFIKKVEALKNK